MWNSLIKGIKALVGMEDHGKGTHGKAGALQDNIWIRKTRERLGKCCGKHCVLFFFFNPREGCVGEILSPPAAAGNVSGGDRPVAVPLFTCKANFRP